MKKSIVMFFITTQLSCNQVEIPKSIISYFQELTPTKIVEQTREQEKYFLTVCAVVKTIEQAEFGRMSMQVRTPLSPYNVTTPLHQAAMLNNLFEIEHLITSGKIDVNQKTMQGWTALHVAAFEGNIESAELLIKLNANIDAQTNNGNTALHLAAMNGHTQVFRSLVDADADLDIDNCNHLTPKEMAETMGRAEIEQLCNLSESYQ
jgi:hypothetical protein